VIAGVSDYDVFMHSCAMQSSSMSNDTEEWSTVPSRNAAPPNRSSAASSKPVRNGREKGVVLSGAQGVVTVLDSGTTIQVPWVSKKSMQTIRHPYMFQQS
jgi:hypothetical protein